MGIFQDPDISNNIFPFPTSPAINDTLRTYLPMSGKGSLYLVQIRYAITEIFVCERRWVRGGSISWKSRRERSTEDDDSFTFDTCRFVVHGPNLAEIG